MTIQQTNTTKNNHHPDFSKCYQPEGGIKTTDKKPGLLTLRILENAMETFPSCLSNRKVKMRQKYTSHTYIYQKFFFLNNIYTELFFS
jgi:hypothetical protein